MRELTADDVTPSHARTLLNALQHVTNLRPTHPANFPKDAISNTLELFNQTGMYRPRLPLRQVSRASTIAPTTTQADVELSTLC